MKTLATCFLLAVAYLHTTGQSTDVQLITQLMANQEAAWNKGDLNAFMQGYLKSDSLLFVGSKGASYGWDTTLQHYKRGYPDTAAMGKLHFDNLEFRRLSSEYYFVLGKWHLSRSIGDTGGFYTLLFRKIKGQWYITADHSS